jgi:hypothetical protein
MRAFTASTNAVWRPDLTITHRSAERPVSRKTGPTSPSWTEKMYRRPHTFRNPLVNTCAPWIDLGDYHFVKALPQRRAAGPRCRFHALLRQALDQYWATTYAGQAGPNVIGSSDYPTSRVTALNVPAARLSLVYPIRAGISRNDIEGALVVLRCPDNVPVVRCPGRL